MPFYEYECKNCGHTLEAMQKVSDGPLRKCPHCGKSQLQRLMSAPVFRLKGGGWYETDFKGDQDHKRNLADRPESDSKDDKRSAGEAKKDDAKDAKPAEKPAEKAADKPAEKSGGGAAAKKAAPAGPGAKRSGAKPAKKAVKKAPSKTKKAR